MCRLHHLLVLLAAQMVLPGCWLVLACRLRRCAIGQEVVYTLMQDLTFTLCRMS